MPPVRRASAMLHALIIAAAAPLLLLIRFLLFAVFRRRCHAALLPHIDGCCAAA